MLLGFALLLLLTDPKQVQSLLQRGLVALQQGQLPEARDALEEAAKADPRNAYVWSSLAEAYFRLKQPDKASAAAETAEKIGADNPVIDRALAMYYSEAGQFGRAAELDERVWRRGKTDPRIAFEFAQALMRTQDFTRAADVVSGALDEHPDDAQLTLALGVARYGQRRFEDAIVAFLKVIQLDPQPLQPYEFLGRILDQAGAHLPEITRDYEQWAARDPKNAQAKLLLAKALLASDRRNPSAEALLRESITLDANDWESHYELGVMLEEKRNYQVAAAELTRSIELDPKQAMPHYHLARVYDRLGDTERAKSERQIHEQLADRGK